MNFKISHNFNGLINNYVLKSNNLTENDYKESRRKKQQICVVFVGLNYSKCSESTLFSNTLYCY